MTPVLHRVGEFIEDRYRVLKIFGGGMAMVYAALDIALDQLVAIKTLRLTTAEGANRFLSEAQTWILLERHQHIVRAKSTFVIGQQPFVVTEYIDGGDLRDRLRNGPVEPRTVLELALQFCAGAEYAYRKLGLIHRDIKPGNLLLTRKGTLKITDFGLSKVGKENTGKGTIMGTFLYMAPEQWLDADAVTKQSDIYSFGFVLYELLTGKHPFHGAGMTRQVLCAAHAEQTIPEPRALNPAIPDRLSKIVMKCLEKNPLRRFFYYEDMAEELQAAYQEHTGTPYVPPPDEEGAETGDSQAELLNSGDALLTIGRCAEAMAYYDRLLDLQPSAALFWQRKGEALARLGRVHEAVLYFDKALENEPSNLEAGKGKVKGLIRLGKHPQALACCSPLLALHPADKELLKLKQQLLEESTPEALEALMADFAEPRPAAPENGAAGDPSTSVTEARAG
jgi:tetratricopeptide (TPR) repeat protein